MQIIVDTLARPFRSLAGWFADPGGNLPEEVRLALIHSLYGSLAIFIGVIVNTMAVSAVVAIRIPTTAFLVWAGLEIVLGVLRIPVMIAGRRAIAEGKAGPTNLYILLSLLWAASLGYGTLICVTSGDWVVATLACLSAVAMVGGICFRNFAAPRLVGAMIALGVGPCALGALMSGEPVLLIVGLQVPAYLAGMTLAAFHLNRMMVRTMLAERDNDHRARHDAMTGLLNRAGLSREVNQRTAAEEAFALFYLDLDGFKAVNDTFGHQIGDEMLKSVAERLRALARPGDAIARIGGDEFVILAGEPDPVTALAFGETVVSALGDTGYFIGSEAAFVGVSVGAAIYPQHGRDLGSLLGEADAALYQAKFWGRSRCVIARSAASTAGPPTVPTPPTRLKLPDGDRHQFDRDAA